MDRAKIFVYSESYHIEEIRIFVRNDRTFDFQNLNSLKGKLGLQLLGRTYGHHFDTFAADNLQIEEYAHYGSGMKRIHKGRRDFLILALFDGLISAKKYWFASEIIPLPKNAVQLPVHFLISKKSPCRGLI